VADYKSTINLPETGFPMKADLAQREPKMLASWEARDIYGKIRAISKGRPRFVLHDGPPYANGAAHLGHFVNKVLKDIVVKSHQLDGYDSPYIPGWDCHGLPIEHQIEKKFGRVGNKLNAKEFRAACRKFAMEQVELQRGDFKRFGVLGDWNRPYMTMDPRFEAQQVRSLGKIIRNGHLYKGAKPVYWCWIAARRWPKPRWSTRTRLRPPSTCSSAWSTTRSLRNASGSSRRPSPATPCRW
jgi:isoleucyl-tRNA synthetase